MSRLSGGARRWLRRTLNVAAVVVLAGGFSAVVVVLQPAGQREQMFGYTIVVHDNGRLDVARGGRTILRWYDFGHVAIPVAFVTVLAYAVLRSTAAAVGRPWRPDDAESERRSFPMN